MKNIYLVVVLIFGAIVLNSCGEAGGSEKTDVSNRKINVVATTGMIGDAVRNVGGERVSVTALMGPGVDPHLYKASAGDVSRMSEADMIFYNGLHLEGKMTEVFDQMQRFATVVAVADGVDEEKLEKTAQFAGNHDPHIWFDVSIWMQVIQHVAAKLSEKDPAHAEIYRENAENYLSRLQELHSYIQSEVQKVPAGQRVLVTAHDAFHYFGKAYGFEVRGLQGISTASETGTADVQNLAEYIVERKIPAIFVETSVPPRYIEALQAAVNSRGFNVKIGGSLFSDAMGNPGTPEGEYPGMVRHNVDTIVGALSAGEQQPL